MRMSNSNKIKFLLSRVSYNGENVPNRSLMRFHDSWDAAFVRQRGSSLGFGTELMSPVWHQAKGSNLAQVDTFFSLCLRNELQDSDLLSFSPQWSLSPLLGLWKTSRTTCSQLSAEVFDHHHYKWSQQLGEGSEWAGSELTLNKTPNSAEAKERSFKQKLERKNRKKKRRHSQIELNPEPFSLSFSPSHSSLSYSRSFTVL